MQTSNLLNDRAISDMLCMSPSWVRKQRWLRRKGEPHILTIDPILIGSTPRYRQPDVITWLEAQPTQH